MHGAFQSTGDDAKTLMSTLKALSLLKMLNKLDTREIKINVPRKLKKCKDIKMHGDINKWIYKYLYVPVNRNVQVYILSH